MNTKTIGVVAIIGDKIYLKSINKCAYILITLDYGYNAQLDRCGNVCFVLENRVDIKEVKEHYEKSLAEGLELNIDLVKYLDKCVELKKCIRELKGEF